MTKTDVTLMPCPSCGPSGRPELHGSIYRSGRYARCEVCRFQGPANYDQTKAVAAWNTRATPAFAPDDLVERVAKALAFADLANYERPLRWPSSPTDVISGRDGTVPFTWDFAETCRKRARAAMPTPNLVEQLIDAMNALLRARKGVVPDIARPFYDAQIGAFTAVREEH